jgi:fucose permease
MLRGRLRPPVLLSYAAFVLVGVSAGTSGVLLLAQMTGYGLGRATIGLTFFTGSAGFVLAGISSGALIHRFGFRIALAVGGGAFVLAGLYLASRPPFVAFVLVNLVTGYATGILESVLNAYLAELPGAATLLNRLHAFFGVGALLGPVLAAWIVGVASWPVVWLVMAVACVPLFAGFLLAYPARPPDGAPAYAPEPAVPAALPAELAAPAGQVPGAAAQVPEPTVPGVGGLLGAALRDRGVLLGSAMLAVYVGLELGVGNWGFSYLVQARSLPGPLAGYAVSGYWLGLTLGRFLISPLATRIDASPASMMYACLAGVTATGVLVWLVPGAALASAGLVLLGFFLGPVFPTTIAISPQLTPARLRPTAIGVMNAASVVGGSGLPWLAGAITQSAGIGLLLPFSVTLSVLQFAVWWPLARRIRGRG